MKKDTSLWEACNSLNGRPWAIADFSYRIIPNITHIIHAICSIVFSTWCCRMLSYVMLCGINMSIDAVVNDNTDSPLLCITCIAFMDWPDWCWNRNIPGKDNIWLRHQMEILSVLLSICAGNSPVSGEFPAQRPVTRSFDVFFHLRLIKRLSKHSWGWWLETQSRPLRRHCNEYDYWCPDSST